MTTPTPGAPIPPGWYPDVAGVTRWWDGTQWTANTLGATSMTPELPRVPEGTPTYTRWIWWIVFLPFAVLIPLIGYLVDLQARMEALIVGFGYAARSVEDPAFVNAMVQQQMGLIFNPWYFALMLISLAIMGVTIWFAYLDRRDLMALGYARPFHWAWCFLGQVVYVIGRSVIVRRRSGRGLAPMWVTIAVQVVLLIAVLVWSIVFMVSIAQLSMSLSGM